MIFIHTRINGGFYTKRAWSRATKAAHADTGEYWQTKMLKRHFRRDSKTKYGHSPRTAAYLRRKKRDAQRGKAKYQGEVDNVRSGLLEQSLRSASTVRAFPSRVTISMHGPRYITMRPYQSNQPDKAAEILRVTPDEDRELMQVFDAALTKYLDIEERRMAGR